MLNVKSEILGLEIIHLIYNFSNFNNCKPAIIMFLWQKNNYSCMGLNKLVLLISCSIDILPTMPNSANIGCQSHADVNPISPEPCEFWINSTNIKREYLVNIFCEYCCHLHYSCRSLANNKQTSQVEMNKDST